MRVILLLFLFIFINAKTMTAQYYAKYGWFGTIAQAKATYENNMTNYKIHIITKTEGFAETFVKLTQYYDSAGIVKNGKLIPLKYINTIIRNGKKYKLIYTFDYSKKEIIKQKYKGAILKYTKKMPFFTNNDILTLYFNLPLYIKHIDKNKTYTFYALGGRKKDGKVSISFPAGEELENIKKELGNTKGLYIKADLYNKVFAGDKGILYLVINPDNWITLKGIVKNVLKIGDLKGSIKSYKILP